MTGVTKFAKVSIFSKLNNITDITMHEDFSEMFGYTQDELLKYFDEYLEDAVTDMVPCIIKISLTKYC